MIQVQGWLSLVSKMAGRVDKVNLSAVAGSHMWGFILSRI